MNSEDLAIGIDLGTTYSCVAVYQKDRVKIIANDEGNLTTSSCVAFTATERLIGDAAKSQVVLNPENTIFDSKRMIGRKFNDPKIQQDLDNWQFKVVNKDGKTKIRAEVEGETKTFFPEEISAMVLAKMKMDAESYLGKKVMDAVISVPACFNDSQRQATINAASIAGLNVIRIITEPTAAALAYRVNKKLKGMKTVLIFDLGGGTLDASVINIDDDWQFEVKTTAGDGHLGGEDFNNVLVAHFVEEFKTKHRRDLRTCPKAVRRLRIACEMAKKTLSSCHETWIDLGCLFKGIDFHSKLTRRQFEGMCMDLFRSTLKPVERVLSDAKMDKGSIDEVVLVGGSTRIPKIRELLKDFFDGKEPLMSINPDEAVAYGAAVQALVLNGRAYNLDLDNIYSVLLIDVNPLSLGIWTKGGEVSTVIKRNSRTPSSTPRIFSTDVDNQSNIDLLVYEGEQAMAKDNHMLGRFRIDGIAPAPKRVPRIKVWFLLDLNGILSVDAESDQKLTVTNYKDGPSVEDIERMTDEARVCEKEDEVQRDRKLAWNDLESYVYSVKESVEYSPDDRLSFMDRKVVMKLCELFRGWMEENPLAGTVDINLKLSEARQRLNPYMVQVEESKHPEPDLMEYGDLIIDESR